MAIQRHPVDSFDKKLNFWEEFQDYKLHPIFNRLWKNNNKSVEDLKQSSLFMWALVVCYDRKSSVYAQPEIDKWEVASEDLFGDKKALLNFALYDDEKTDDPFANKEPVIKMPMDLSFRQVISEFEKTIDTPLGLTLRELERKLIERTEFIMETPYSIDSFVEGKMIKGTADQLDKMFANTEKINKLITTALADLRAASGDGTTKGGQKESLGDKANDF